MAGVSRMCCKLTTSTKSPDAEAPGPSRCDPHSASVGSFPRLRFVHRDTAPAELSLVKFLNRLFRSLDHLDKSESSRFSSLWIPRKSGAENAAIRGKHLPQFISVDIEGQVSDEDFRCQQSYLLGRSPVMDARDRSVGDGVGRSSRDVFPRDMPRAVVG